LFIRLGDWNDLVEGKGTNMGRVNWSLCNYMSNSTMWT